MVDSATRLNHADQGLALFDADGVNRVKIAKGLVARPMPDRPTKVGGSRPGIRRDYRVSYDSPPEGNGFERPVPRAMQERLEAIIACFGCDPPSPDHLRAAVGGHYRRRAKANLGWVAEGICDLDRW